MLTLKRSIFMHIGPDPISWKKISDDLQRMNIIHDDSVKKFYVLP
jgi:hypothetical protein